VDWISTPSRDRGDGLADLAHDLKKPLAVVRGGAQLLNRRLGRPEPLDRGAIREGLALIEGATGRTTLLLKDLLEAVASGVAGDPALDRRPVDLLRLAQQAAARYQGTTERHTIRVEAADEAIVGFWDPARLDRVLVNLLSNAVKFSPDGGEIVVVEGAWVVLSVADQGLGIPADEIDRVFDRMHRGANCCRARPGDRPGPGGRAPGRRGPRRFDRRRGPGGHWTLRFLSAYAERVTGYPASDFLGVRPRRTWASVIHPEDRAAVYAAVHGAVARGEPFDVEYRVVHADATVRWVHDRSVAVTYPGEDVCIEGVALDVTKRRRAEEERDRLLALSSDLLCTASPDGRLVQVNAEW
jgi:PAS domain S-box-containing protein